jgi:hypothetical protein
MMKKRGYVCPSYGMLVEDDRDFLETYDKLYELAMLRTRIFLEEINALFFICAIAARNPGNASARTSAKSETLERLE